jgi:hypothetical protein
LIENGEKLDVVLHEIARLCALADYVEDKKMLNKKDIVAIRQLTKTIERYQDAV